ncbi:hypothetical protein [Pontibacter litorisediminis]|uniref:hypothetical protein n=1 Tax=Pontibacter litorisediminis TaxID=1846260 RepID=UPI0023EB225F|nr:hypothetical protein [Pontibacter litorisediminis]
MKLPKLLASAFLIASLYACNDCEDVNLGKLEFTGELSAFVPAPDKTYHATLEEAKLPMSYGVPGKYTTVEVPVRKKNYSGKFDLNSCKEYYTAEEKEYIGQISGESRFSIKLKLRKDVDPQRFNSIYGKPDVSDVMEFTVGYKTRFPSSVTYVNQTYTEYTTTRTFVLDDAATSTFNKITYTQEFLPTVTLQGVEHANVYHFFLNEALRYNADERYFQQYYPLDYVQGIYVKEGVGLIQAYTAGGEQIGIAMD